MYFNVLIIIFFAKLILLSFFKEKIVFLFFQIYRTLLFKYTKYIYCLGFFYLLSIGFTFIQAHPQHVNFTENKGQWQKKVAFKADLDGGALFVESNCFTYNFYNKTAFHQNHIHKNGKLKKVNSHAFKMNFLNAASTVEFRKDDKSKARKNFFIGKNPENWSSNVPSWGKIAAQSVYPGIDMETEGIQNGIKYQFKVAPFANYRLIQLQFEGLDRIWVLNNELHLKTSVNEMIDQAPVAWQVVEGKNVNIKCNYILKDNVVSFELGANYNPSVELIIDPVLVFASYTGSTADNFGLTATYDNNGNLYAGGLIYNVGYPTTLGAYDDSYNGVAQYGRTDIAISKFDSTGATLLYSTYLGGANNTEVVQSMVVNSLNELCLYGSTSSNDFPITSNAYDTTFNGGVLFQAQSNGTYFDNGTDIFVSKFSVDGSQLLASTYFGGTDNDGVNTTAALTFNYGDFYRGEINVDFDDNIIIGSCTNSNDYPITSNAVQLTKGNLQDGCIFKMDGNLQTLMYSTFIGGNQDDAIYAIATSGTDVYATGGTISTDIQTNADSYHPNYLGGPADGIVAKISTVGIANTRISYIGTVDYDQCFFIQLDAQENVFLYGQTNSPTFPYIGGVYQNANSGQFIIKLDSLLNNVLISTTFGNGNGTPNISPSAFLVDDCGHIYISGWGGNILTGVATNNMPLTNNAFQSTTDGFNFYLAVFEHDMDSLIYATYFGGGTSHEHVDGGTSRFDKKGIVYQAVCAGCGSNDDFPTTPGAWSNTNNSSNCNEGVFKFDFEIGIVSADFTASPLSGCSPLTVNFSTSNTSNYFWDFGNNDTTSTELNPIRTFTTPGVYPVIFITRNINSCNLADTIVKYITVNQGLTADFSNTIVPCENTINFTDLTINTFPSASSWLWSFGDNTTSTLQNPIHTYAEGGNYTVQLTVSDTAGCSGTVDTVITLSTLQAQESILTFCGNNNVNFNAQPDSAGAYLWNFGIPAAPGNTSPLQQTDYLYPDTGVYNAYLVVYWGTNNQCSDTSFFDVNINPPFVASIEHNQDSCSNQVQFTETTNNTLNPSVQWQWNFGDGQNSTFQNPSNNFTAGNYLVSLIVTAENGCIDTVTTPVNIKNYEPYSINNDTLLCLVPTELLLQATGGDFYIWQPPSLFNNPFSSNQLVNISSDTSFTVMIGRINNEGDTCLQSYSTNISVSAISQTNFSIDAEKDTIFVGESTPINVVISSGNFTFLWTPAQGIDNVNTDNVVATPTVTTEYTLTVNEGNYCSKSEKVNIVVFKADCTASSLFVPNTFTPNGDGKNDKLFVRGNYIAQLYFAVYNRWGEKIFETTDKNIGWDGYYQGNLADPGVFGWYLKATCKKGETAEMKGNVTLIR
jgi:gliding motility-associated-like protein